MASAETEPPPGPGSAAPERVTAALDAPAMTLGSPARPTTGGPGHSLSLPLAYARFACPTCGETRRFETRPDAGDGGRVYRCKCGTELGRFEVNRAGYTVLRLACGA